MPSHSRWKRDLTPIVRLQTFCYAFPGRCVVIKLSQGHAGWARKCYVTRDMCGIAESLAKHDTANLGGNKQLPWRPGTAARQNSEDTTMSLLPGPPFRNNNENFKGCLGRHWHNNRNVLIFRENQGFFCHTFFLCLLLHLLLQQDVAQSSRPPLNLDFCLFFSCSSPLFTALPRYFNALQ